VLSPDSKWISFLLDSGDLVLYNVDSKSTRPLKLADPALSFGFTADGPQLITAGTDGKVQTWDMASGKPLTTLYEAGTSVLSLAVSKTLLAIGLTDHIAILDLANGKTLTNIESDGDHSLMAFNADASMLASANSSGQINVWKEGSEGFEPLPSITTEQIFSLLFSPQGDQLLAGAQDVVYVFDPLTGKEVRRIPHKDIVRGMSFSGDGKTLATASNTVIQLWDFQAIPIIREDELVKTACGRLIQNFDVAQWRTFFPDDEPRPLCPDLPVPE
jgi:WD40 repeat protein